MLFSQSKRAEGTLGSALHRQATGVSSHRHGAEVERRPHHVHHSALHLRGKGGETVRERCETQWKTRRGRQVGDTVKETMRHSARERR
jgi:hypothetical protein